MSVADTIISAWNRATERSALSFAGNGGVEFSIGKLALTLQDFQIKSDDGGSASYDFYGVGLALPGKGASVSISVDDFPSLGSPIYNGTFTDGALDFDSIAGPASVVSLSAAPKGGGPSISIAFVFFNQYVDFVLFRGVMGTAGLQLAAGGGGPGLVIYKGYLKKTESCE